MQRNKAALVGLHEKSARRDRRGTTAPPEPGKEARKADKTLDGIKAPIADLEAAKAALHSGK